MFNIYYNYVLRTYLRIFGAKSRYVVIYQIKNKSSIHERQAALFKKKGGKVRFAILHVSYDDFKQFWNFVYTKGMSFYSQYENSCQSFGWP